MKNMSILNVITIFFVAMPASLVAIFAGWLLMMTSIQILFIDGPVPREAYLLFLVSLGGVLGTGSLWAVSLINNIEGLAWKAGNCIFLFYGSLSLAWLTYTYFHHDLDWLEFSFPLWGVFGIIVAWINIILLIRSRRAPRPPAAI